MEPAASNVKAEERFQGGGSTIHFYGATRHHMSEDILLLVEDSLIR